MAMRRARAPRRKLRRARVKRGRRARLLRAPAAKHYTYDFNLLPQLMVVDTTTGVVAMSSASGSGSFPLVNANIQQYSSATGFTNVTDIAASVGIRINDAVNASTFLGMYDAYKINSVTCTIEFLNNSSSVSGPGFMPTLYLYNDQDDIVVPPTLQSLTGKQGFKTFQFGNNSRTKFSYKWRPSVSQALNTLPTGTFPTGIGKSQWINCASSGQNVVHYGLKMWIADVYNQHPGTAQTAFRISWRYNVSFRSPLIAA